MASRFEEVGEIRIHCHHEQEGKFPISVILNSDALVTGPLPEKPGAA